MKCIACNQIIQRSELISCKTCKGVFHYRCHNISSATYLENANDFKRSWQCSSCSNARTRRKRNDNTPVTPGIHNKSNDSSTGSGDILDEPNELQKIEDVELIPKTVASPDKDKNFTLSYNDLSSLLDSKLQKIEMSITEQVKATIKSEITSAIDKLKSEFTETTDFLDAEQKDLKKDINSANDKIKSLEAENLKLSKELTSLGRRIRPLEKSSRSCNVEIQVVPENKEENVTSIFKKLCEKIDFPIVDSEISSVRRVAKLNPSSDRPRNILVTLKSERQRDDLISAYRGYNKNNKNDLLNSSHLNISGEKQRIFVTEHLSSEVKELHSAARKTAKERGYKFVWIKYGRIYVRKSDDDSTPILIKEHSCLSKLV